MSEQSMTSRASARHYLLLGALAFSWGSGFLFVELALLDLPPVMIAMGRTAVATAVLYAAALRQGHSLPALTGNGQLWLILPALAVVGHALPFFLMAQA